MFGQLGQITNLLRNGGKIKESAARMQERLKAARFVGEAGGGQVQATCDGRTDVLGVRIAAGLVQSGDVELLEDLVTAAIREALQRAREGAKKEMDALATELGLPGIGGMLDQLQG